MWAGARIESQNVGNAGLVASLIVGKNSRISASNVDYECEQLHIPFSFYQTSSVGRQTVCKISASTETSLYYTQDSKC